MGDAVLLEVSRALSCAGAIVGRYGGDEFVAVLPGADRAAAASYRDQVDGALAEICVTPARAPASRSSPASGWRSTPKKPRLSKT
jgi:GGDEF domain-containing protein